MKFATFFTALVASATAADNKAPVISLNLVGAVFENPNTGDWAAHTHGFNLAIAGNSAQHTGGHPSSESNAYADECEVTGNSSSESGDACTEPTAEALDHHDGDVTVVKTYHTVVKSEPTQWVGSDSGLESDAVTCEAADSTCLDSFAKRAEYVIEYDATDDDGNDAETVTFALIVRDRSAPVCKSGQDTPYCSPGTDSSEFHYIQLGDTCGTLSSDRTDETDIVTSCSQVVELCDVQNWADSTADLTGDIAWANTNTGTYSDAYEGDLAATAKLYSSNSFTAADAIASSTTHIPAAQFHNLDAEKTIHYEYDVNDYAGIFGRLNINNHLIERGSMKLEDTKKPILTGITIFTEAECGYTAPDTVTASYDDCYDSWNTSRGGADENLTPVEIHDATGTDGNGTGNGTPWSTRKTWSIGAVTMADGVSTGYDRANNNPNTRDMVDGAFDSSTYSDFSVFFNVKDHFGNAADEEFKNVKVKDSLAPTLYITGVQQVDSVAHGSHNCLGGDGTEADRFTAAEDGANQVGEDITEAHCNNAEEGATDGTTYGFYEHTGSTENIEHSSQGDFSAIASEIEIQHSAGYDDDYTFITELLVDGTGYRCSDGCWNESTTTVQWVSGSCAGAAGGDFDMKVVGDYYLHYSCTDGSGWVTTACRTFHNVDKTRPVITVLQQANDASGKFILEATRDSNYVDEGATCSDIVDGTISSSVKVSGDLVDMATPGEYVIKYNCKDSAENEALEAYRTVEVVDRTCPTCSMPQAEAKTTLTVEASFPYTDATVDCTDNIDGAIHGQYLSGAPPATTSYFGDLSGIDVETVNSNGYVVTYYSKDTAGNSYLNCYQSPPAEGPITTEETQDTRIYRTVVVTDTLVPTVEISYEGTVLNDRGSNPEVIMDTDTDYMAENRLSANGWVIGAVASAVSGVALLGYAATRKAAVATSVPV